MAVNLEFYHPQLWHHSRVNRSFSKLFASDIHSLQKRREFEGPDLTRFWLNHPIRWVQLTAIVVGITWKEKHDILIVDDSSGATIELIVEDPLHRSLIINLEEDEKQSQLWKRKTRRDIIDVGTLVKAKGELRESWGVHQVGVMRIDIVCEPNIEIKEWQDRINFKKTILSKPWVLHKSLIESNEFGDRSKSSTNNSLHSKEKSKMRKQRAKSRQVDFSRLPVQEHTIRNLKLLLLSRLSSLRKFTIVDLRSISDVEFAARCVVAHDLTLETLPNETKYTIDKEVERVLLACLGILARDGCIIIPKAATAYTDEGIPMLENQGILNHGIAITSSEKDVEQEYIVVGSWNIGNIIKSLAKRDNQIRVRDVYVKIQRWGNGWEGVTKGVVADVVEEVLREQGSEKGCWIVKDGVWTFKRKTRDLV